MSWSNASNGPPLSLHKLRTSDLCPGVRGQPCPSPQHFPRERTAEDRLLIRQTIIRNRAVCQADGWCSGTLPLSLMEHGFTTAPPHLSLSPSRIDPCVTVLTLSFLLLSCDKEEDVSSCQGVKYVPCVKSWWVAPLCFSEEFSRSPRRQHQLIWVLWVSSKWSVGDTNLHLQSEPCPTQGLGRFQHVYELHIVDPLPAPEANHRF